MSLIASLGAIEIGPHQATGCSIPSLATPSPILALSAYSVP